MQSSPVQGERGSVLGHFVYILLLCSLVIINLCPLISPSPPTSVLLVSPPSLPQLGTILPSTQASPPVSQPVTSQHAARIVSHLAAGSLPQVRMVSTPSGLASSAGNQQATLVHQAPHQIRMPVSVSAISQVCTENTALFFLFLYRERRVINV